MVKENIKEGGFRPVKLDTQVRSALTMDQTWGGGVQLTWDCFVKGEQEVVCNLPSRVEKKSYYLGVISLKQARGVQRHFLRIACKN